MQINTDQSRADIPADQSKSVLTYFDLVKVDHDLPEPAYRQLAAILRDQIAAGEWRTGPLPSVKQLQQEHDVGRDTVLRAIEILRAEGLVFTVPRRGTYVSPRK
jgi:GntR family transcriptional regulator